MMTWWWAPMDAHFGFWMTSHRCGKIKKEISPVLYKPQTALRPVEHEPRYAAAQEEPGGQNPPDGAIIDYYLKADAKEVTLEILDSKNELVRKYSSNDTLTKPLS